MWYNNDFEFIKSKNSTPGGAVRQHKDKKPAISNLLLHSIKPKPPLRAEGGSKSLRSAAALLGHRI